MMNSEKERHLARPDIDLPIPIATACFTGSDNQLQYSNEMFNEILGVKHLPSEEVSSALAQYLDGEFAGLLQAAFTSGKPQVSNDVRYCAADQEVWLYFQFMPVTNLSDETSGVNVHAYETRSLPHANVSDSTSHDASFLRNILDTIPDFVSYIDDQERYIYVNKAYDEWFGNVRMKTIREVVSERTYAVSRRALAKVLSGENVIYENSLYKEGHPKRDLQVEFIPDKKDDGSVQGFVVIGHDIKRQFESENYLEQTEIRFKRYAEAMPQMAFIADGKGNIIYFNTRWYDYIGHLEGTEGWGWAKKDIHHPDDLQRTLDTWQYALDTGKSYEVEYRLKNANGQYRWHLGRAEPVKNVEGNIEYWLGTNTDIHSQKQAEQRLRQSEEYYKTMTDNTPVMTWITRADGYCSYLNKQWYDYTGQRADEGIGYGWDEAVHPEDRENTYRIFNNANEMQVPFDLEYRIRDRYGNYKWHIGTGLPKFDEHGVYEGFVGAVIDIHERKIAKERLIASEEFNRTLLESSPDCVKALDLEANLLSMNRQGLRMNHIEDFSIVKGKPWLDFWQGEHHEAAKAAFRKALDGKVGHFTGSSVRKQENTWWDVLIAPVYNHEGKVSRLIAVSRDVTNIKNLERQKDDFISIASHELKTPVTSIKAYTQVLQDRFQKANDGASANMLAKMDRQLNKLTGLISDLLDVTKIEQGKMRFMQDIFDLNDLAAETIEEIQRTTLHHSVNFERREAAVVRADKERIGQVITNFLTNAIKYSPSNTDITIKVETHNGMALLRVEDAGLGLNEQEKDRVFERFYRVGEEGHETYPGLGLGLYIAKEIIKRHDGDIGVDSMKDSGSTFHFRLPLHDQILC